MQFGEDPDFVQGDTFLPIFVLLLHFFDGDQLASLLVEGLDYRPEAPIA